MPTNANENDLWFQPSGEHMRLHIRRGSSWPTFMSNADQADLQRRMTVIETRLGI